MKKNLQSFHKVISLHPLDVIFPFCQISGFIYIYVVLFIIVSNLYLNFPLFTNAFGALSIKNTINQYLANYTQFNVTIFALFVFLHMLLALTNSHTFNVHNDYCFMGPNLLRYTKILSQHHFFVFLYLVLFYPTQDTKWMILMESINVVV